MLKKILAIVLTLLIAFVWFVTIKGIGPIGPIQNDIKLGLDISGGVYVVMEAQTQELGADANLSELMEQTKSVIERRVNEMGLSEPIVTIEGENRIRVELPGADNSDEAISAIGRTAQLKFLLADGTEMLSGTDISNSGVDRNQELTGGYDVTLKFTKSGGDNFYEATRRASAGEIANDDRMKDASGAVAKDASGNEIAANAIVIMLDNEIISAPTARQAIQGTEARITGNFTEDEAKQLSMLIRGGALPVDLKEVESSAIGATLGMGALKSSLTAGIIGIGLVLLLMLFMYRLPGLGANCALLLYIPGLLWVVVLLKGVLTLPGIAGIVLSIGMAVDANVIIFARIREEVASGKSLRVACSHGFRNAFRTVLDSQVTTFIAALILYQFGTGPVRGFALTLMIGIIIGMITAVVVTWVYVGAFVETAFLAKPFLLGVREPGSHEQVLSIKHKFNFIRHRRIYYIVTVSILVVGIGVGLIRGYNFGIDFTGGTRFQLDMGREVSVSEVDDVLNQNGITDAEIIHYGDNNEGIIIKTTKALDNEARNDLQDSFFKEFDVDESAVESFEQFGPSIGDLLKKNAVTAVLISALGMLIYIILRFRWRFGVASIIGVFHDVFIMIALYGLLHMSINNPFIAAILTVVGYSINDTIVIFDRIRENQGTLHREKPEAIIDISINQTLVRSLMTGLSTMVAITPLIILGGDTIRQFTVPLLIGIACGAASSIFVASPLYYDLLRLTDRNGKSRYGGGKGGSGRQRKSEGEPEKNIAATGTGVRGHSKKSKSKRSLSSDNGGAVV
jgi:SecD/SecF fusion protein